MWGEEARQAPLKNGFILSWLFTFSLRLAEVWGAFCSPQRFSSSRATARVDTSAVGLGSYWTITLPGLMCLECVSSSWMMVINAILNALNHLWDIVFPSILLPHTAPLTDWADSLIQSGSRRPSVAAPEACPGAVERTGDGTSQVVLGKFPEVA